MNDVTLIWIKLETNQKDVKRMVFDSRHSSSGWRTGRLFASSFAFPESWALRITSLETLPGRRCYSGTYSQRKVIRIILLYYTHSAVRRARLCVFFFYIHRTELSVHTFSTISLLFVKCNCLGCFLFCFVVVLVLVFFVLQFIRQSKSSKALFWFSMVRICLSFEKRFWVLNSGSL